MAGMRVTTRLQTEAIDIPPGVQESWQKSVNLIARVANVPAALVMRVHPEDIEVFTASQSEGNPYRVGERAPLDTGLYCETVMAQRDRLLVPNALVDPAWDHNPDIELNMVSYMGWPIVWPNGDVFGTICLLDNKANAYDDTRSELLYEFKELIEYSLRAIYDDQLLDSTTELAQRLNEERRTLKKLATTDSLCRICNRRALIEQGNRVYERMGKAGLPVAVLIVDVDNFKKINDSFGHLRGDGALLHIASLLESVSRPGDTVARYGGDEFCLLAPEVGADAAMALAGRILEAVRAEPLQMEGQTLALSVSIGVYAALPSQADLHTAIQRADTALLVAKRQGRNRAELWAPDEHALERSA